MRYLAIDPGGKRTGLAVGDDETAIVTALPPVITAEAAQRLDGIARMVDQQDPDVLVLGLPLNMDGSEGEPAKAARRLADQLMLRFDLPVHLADERLTSVEADGRLARSGLTHQQKKLRRDGQAAAALLRDFLAQHRGGA